MTECLNNMLSRNKKMTYEKIAKEMGKQFSSEDIELYLQEILSNNTSMYNDAEDTYYFKK
jgi:predicted HTH transcriptional regulator